MNDYQLGKLARQDLRDIWNHIADDNPDAADQMVELIVSKFATLAASPGIGSARPDFDGGDIRIFPVKNYAIFYRPADIGIEIARVVHAARDFSLLSFG